MEQRADSRVGLSVHLFVTLDDGKRLTGTTENLSVEGAMITVPSSVPLPPGTHLELRFELPHGADTPVPVETGASVIWSSEVVPGLLGVEFSPGLGTEAASALESHR
jgi:hypothetical protein